MSKWGVALPRSSAIPGWRVDPRGQRPRIVGWKTTPDVATPTAGRFIGRAGVNTNFHSVIGSDPSWVDTRMTDLTTRGIRWIREAILWDSVEHVQGVRVWTTYDAIFDLAAARGINVLGLLCYSAAWAAPGVNYPPTSNANYANFCVAVLDRYGPGGTYWTGKASQAPITAVELWNEPNLYTTWLPEVSPSGYAAMALAAATAIRAAHPTVKILATGDQFQFGRADAVFGAAWASAVIAAQPTLPATIDAWAVHVYVQDNGDPTDDTLHPVYRFAKLAQGRDTERYASGLSLPLWVTEWGWTTAGPHLVSEAVQASRTRYALDTMFQRWGDQSYRPSIEKVFAYAYTGDYGGGELDGYGLIRGADNTYKPALAELAAYA